MLLEALSERETGDAAADYEDGGLGHVGWHEDGDGS